MGRQVLSQLQESRAPSIVTVTWEDKHPHSKCSYLSASLYAEHDSRCSGISLWSVRVSCPSCVPSKLLAGPQPPFHWDSMKNRKGLTVCGHCWAIMKMSLNCAPCFQHKCKAQPHTSYCKKSSQPNPANSKASYHFDIYCRNPELHSLGFLRLSESCCFKCRFSAF